MNEEQNAALEAERNRFEGACAGFGLQLRPKGKTDGAYLTEIHCAWMLWQARAQLAAPAGVPEGWREFIEEVAELAPPYGEIVAMTSGMALGSKARRLLAAAPSPAPTSGVYGADPLACSGFVSGCFRCSAPASDVVQVPRELRPVIAMVLNALDRDAAEGKQARGEMAAELRALLNGGRV